MGPGWGKNPIPEEFWVKAQKSRNTAVFFKPPLKRTVKASPKRSQKTGNKFTTSIDWREDSLKVFDGLGTIDLHSLKNEWVKFLGLGNLAFARKAKSRDKRKIHAFIIHIITLYGFLSHRMMRYVKWVRRAPIHKKYGIMCRALNLIGTMFPCKSGPLEDDPVILENPCNRVFDLYRGQCPPRYGSIGPKKAIWVVPVVPYDTPDLDGMDSDELLNYFKDLEDS